jgi:hypothetical protein
MDVPTTLIKDERGKLIGISGFFGEIWKFLEQHLNFT